MTPKSNALAKMKTTQIPAKSISKAIAVPKVKPQLSQRDSYSNAMNGATKRGGSNGVGVGY